MWPSLILVLLATTITNTQTLLKKVGKGIQKEIADIKHPVETALVNAGSSQCSHVKKLVGVAYEQVEGEKEPDVNKLELDFQTSNYKIKFNINAAAGNIPLIKDYNPRRPLIIYIHGFTDDPSQASFSNISEAFLVKGDYNVLALDGSSLIHWLYLRSTTYIKFMGQKLGETLASMMKSGVNPAQIHIIGHSLGGHIAGFTGKTFTNLTRRRVGRISGLDPAGPCFSHVDDDCRLKDTDAEFVDVIHTDAGVLGITDPVGQVDYYPNNGGQQPNCLWQTCSHSRAWLYFAESVVNKRAFPAVKCASWEGFKKGECDTKDISYMGYPSKPGTRGLYFLQTADESPFGLGENGTGYKNDEGIVKTITQLVG